VTAQERQGRARLVLGENRVVDVREVNDCVALGSSICVFDFGDILNSLVRKRMEGVTRAEYQLHG
jgi:hypothetical protein